MKAHITVTLKSGVLDPQGKAVERSLHALGFHTAQGVRVGKYVEINLGTLDPSAAERQVKEMCEKLLANTVIESYRFDLE